MPLSPSSIISCAHIVLLAACVVGPSIAESTESTGNASVLSRAEQATPAAPVVRAEETGDLAEDNASESGVSAEHPLAHVDDPWESYNRAIHGFNNKADTYLMRPLAVAYDNVTPRSVQQRVTNFFASLASPLTSVNQFLQGRPVEASKTLGRFAVNTTVGVIGLFDPAEIFGLQRRSEDFGQTFATWGWESSRYLVMPFFGPRTVRDVLGDVADSPLAPLGYVDSNTVALSLKGFQVASSRTRLFPFEAIRANALDDYLFVRDAWVQRRNFQIRDE